MPQSIAEIQEFVTFMREHGVQRLHLRDNEIELELSAHRPSSPMTREAKEDQAAEEQADQSLSREKRAEEEHYRKWKRITRSSGAPIPPFVGDT